MIIIGSLALKMRAPYLLDRNPADTDYICSHDEYLSWLSKNNQDIIESFQYQNKFIVKKASGNYEFDIIGDNSSKLFEELVRADNQTFEFKNGDLLPNLDLLFTLKSSHKYKKNSVHFWKNLFDYHRMKDAGAKIKPEYQEFFKLRQKESYDYSHPNLSVSKKDFFSEAHGIQYQYDHDSIHASVANFERPAYTYYAKDGEEVKSDKNKFFSLPEEYRLWGAIEESCVLALERSIVPFPGTLSLKKAWLMAFSKVCTSITSGWFREYCYDNAMKIIPMYPENYYEKFKLGLEKGIIKNAK